MDSSRDLEYLNVVGSGERCLIGRDVFRLLAHQVA